MTEEPDLSPLDLLVLARLLPVGEKGDKPEKIQKDLEPLLEHRWSGSVLTAVVDRALVKLTAQGLVTRLPTRRKNDVPSVAIDPRGPAGCPQVSEGERVTRQDHLGRPQEVSAAGSVVGADRARPGLLQSRGIPGRPAPAKVPPAPGRVPRSQGREDRADEKAPQGTHMRPKEKITIDTIQSALLGGELGEHRPADPKKTLDRLISRQVAPGAM